MSGGSVAILEQRFNSNHGKDGKFAPKAGTGVSLDKVKVGSRLQFSSGQEHGTGKTLTEFRATVARKGADGRLMVNAGTASRPKWVQTHVDKASPVVTAKKSPSGRAGWKDKLTASERDAVRSYKENGYRHVNSSLRNGAALKGGTADRVQAIDSAIAKGYVTSDMRVYRAFRTPDDPQALVGQVFHDKAFVSTSETTKEPLKILGSGGKPGNKILARVDVKAGQPAGFPDVIHGLGEREVLLPRDSRFKVTAATKDQYGIWTVDMEPVA